ncbi:hypothetical protein IU510_27270 [Nocardia cyriacigeorgica]|uniref:hypothetical protein n=1 Tax=Nocardia cyriacigeorgica TaxID=135487 RepID=UPI001895A361|nr:hypothetical protein [Nocardia cyriacigeorgica]MBF6101725.1 hypothetical protein [Nocardia cyriacigeorgica]MBF6158982.1 hypothetical protein [Nocardia cyriacigeorgica]MBF6197332.1 hypothetical protein [Nocardia cyriacigeorgica]
MTETLSASSSEIAGLGVLLASIGADVQATSDFVAKEGRAAEWLHGPIIDTLVAPSNDAADWCTYASRTGSDGESYGTYRP